MEQMLIDAAAEVATAAADLATSGRPGDITRLHMLQHLAREVYKMNGGQLATFRKARARALDNWAAQLEPAE